MLGEVVLLRRRQWRPWWLRLLLLRRRQQRLRLLHLPRLMLPLLMLALLPPLLLSRLMRLLAKVEDFASVTNVMKRTSAEERGGVGANEPWCPGRLHRGGLGLDSLHGCLRVKTSWLSNCVGPAGGVQYRAHTAEEPVDDGPRGRCYGPVNDLNIQRRL